MAQQGFCPACGQFLIQQKANAAVKDFCCSSCNTELEHYLSLKHPINRNIRPKIRQQLEIIRDMGYLSFLSKGYYKITPS